MPWAPLRSSARRHGWRLVQESARRLWHARSAGSKSIESAERGTAGHAAFVAYARSLIKPLSLKLGWDPRADETPGVRKLRRTLFADLGNWRDEGVIAEARRRFHAFADDRKAIEADEQDMVLSIVARNASAVDFEQLHAIAKSSRDETEMRRY